MKKYSIEAKELLTNAELYEIKAGTDVKITIRNDTMQSSCGLMCIACVGCTVCKVCVSKVMDVIAL